MTVLVRRTFLIRSFVLLGVLVQPALAFAQGEAAGAFSEVIDVRVINLEVVVTDGKERVTGLQPEDFLLTVDGAEVPIEYFTEVYGGTSVVRGDEAAGAAVPALAPGVPVSTSYLVFIDNFFSFKQDRDRVLRNLVEQLPMMQPEDRMAVVAFDGSRVEMLSTWSQSVEALSRVYRDAIELPAHGLRRLTRLRQFDSLRAIDIDERGDRVSNPASITDTQLDLEEEHQADLVSAQVERAVLAASATLRSFAKPPGRKVMLLLSGGWPLDPAQWVVQDSNRLVYTQRVARGMQLYEPLIETANLLSYTLYPVDVQGLNRELDVGSDIATLGEAEANRGIFRSRELDEHAALGALARETGGRAILDSGNVKAFERVVTDTRTYYSIGFTPSWQGDDSDHDVDIRMRRPGLDIRSRSGFRDLSRETEVSLMVESTLRVGDPPSAAPLHVELGEPSKAGYKKVLQPLRVLIPLDALTFLPQADGWVAATELRFAVLDEEGNASEIPVLPLDMKLPAEPQPGKFTAYDTSLKMRKKKHDLVVSLYDTASGAILSTKLEVAPEL